ILLSEIPVLLIIHSSEVSTILSRSELVKILSGTQLPIPKMPTLTFSFCLFAINCNLHLFDTVAYFIKHWAVCEVQCLENDIPDGFFIRIAMTLYYESINTEYRRASVF